MVIIIFNTLTQYFVSDPILGLGNTVVQSLARETNSK